MVDGVKDVVVDYVNRIRKFDNKSPIFVQEGINSPKYIVQIVDMGKDVITDY